MKIENITHNVGHSSRTGAIVEPYLCKQWFVKMKPLSQAVDKIQHSKDRTKFFPSRFLTLSKDGSIPLRIGVFLDSFGGDTEFLFILTR